MCSEFCVDPNNRIQKLDEAGNFIRTWGVSGTGDGQFIHPQGIELASSGSIYIADTGNNRIQKIRPIVEV